MSSLEKLKNYYNGIAPGYQELYHKEQKQKITLIAPHLPSSGTLLDAGSGDGVLHEFIPENIEVTAVDISEELLKKNPFNHKQCENLEKLSFKTNSFDILTSFTVLQDVVNKKQAIEEIKRVVKPQGRIIVSFLKISKHKELLEKYLKEEFEITEIIEEEKDLIYIIKNP